MSTIKIDGFCPVGIGGTKGIDTTHLKIFVGGLRPNYSSKDLYDLFSKFGTIRESVVIPDRFRVRSRCYGFVTFANHKAVSEVFRKAPIKTADGVKLTVVLASANTKPRRAHFNVKHGTSGHKPLPMVKEGEEVTPSYNNNKYKKEIPIKDNKTNNKKDKKNGKIGIYTDPSLFRTANIQQIEPASLYITKKKQNNLDDKSWPNEDIKKDYHNLKKIKVSKDNQSAKERKSWKLVAVQQEPDKDSYYSSNEGGSEDFGSVHSRKWTAFSNKRTNGGSTRGFKVKGKGKSKWIKSPSKSTKNDETTDEEGLETEDECDRLTFGSLFDGSYQNMINFEFENLIQSKSEMEELRNMFKNKMQSKIIGKDYVENQSKMTYNNYNNGTWSPYQPTFPFPVNTQSYNGSNNNNNNMGYNYNSMAPTPPIQPIIFNSASNVNENVNCMNSGSNQYLGYNSVGSLNPNICSQTNLYCNTNYFYNHNALQSASNK